MLLTGAEQRTPTATASAAGLIGHRFGWVPPNWFASVMGTGIVAIAIAGIDPRAMALRTVAVVFWAIAVVVFAGVLAATVLHWAAHGPTARGHLRHPVIAHFYGAVPMATLTVGTSTLLVGAPVIGHDLALAVDVVCFSLGTLGGLVTAVVIPARHLVRRAGRGDEFGGWLMSVVGPMVSASAAAVLAGAVGSAYARASLLVLGAAMFTVSLMLSAPVIIVVVRRLLVSGVGPIALAPTWWIVLGPLGQSVTAACLLAEGSRAVVDPAAGQAAHDVAIAYAVPVWAFAGIWVVVATAITVHTVARGLPFALTWWSFTFPLGTFVTGSTALARVEGWSGCGIVAMVGCGVLVAAWFVVAARTVVGLADGSLRRPPAPIGHGTLER